MSYLRVVLFVVLMRCVSAREIDALTLTWVKDPTTTMTILWHTEGGDESSSIVFQQTAISGESWGVEGTSVTVHRVDLENLEPDTLYTFSIQGHDKEYRFRTMPKTLSRPVRFAVGGDAYYYWGAELFKRMNRVVSLHDPDFYVIGGDLAYTTGKKRFFKGPKWEIKRWQSFLRILQRTLKGKDGRIVPFLPVVGNHDIKASSFKPQMFYELFAFPQEKQAYREVTMGDYLSLLLLDTGHTSPIEGRQTSWLEESLKKSHATYRFPIYHIGAYPSYYPYNNKTAQLVRTLWSPLFEQNQIGFAFENHNHCFKRTHPIKGEKVDPTGVVYLGDGSWGVTPRSYNKNLWYIEKAASTNSCYIVSLDESGCTIEAKDSQGDTLDTVGMKR